MATKEAVCRIIEDSREDLEVAGLDKYALVNKYLDRSVAFVGLDAGVPGAAWGVTQPDNFLEPNQLWLVTTPLVDKNKFAFMRITIRFVDWALHTYGVLGGIVTKRNQRSQRWLRWLGFTLGDEIDLPLIGQVYPFQKRLD